MPILVYRRVELAGASRLGLAVGASCFKMLRFVPFTARQPFMIEPTPRRHGPWTIRETRQVYRDPWVAVHRDEVTRPDGLPGSYCVVNLKHGVCVVAVDEQRRIHLTEEFHYGVGRVTLEAVSGGIEEGDDSDATARRELAEELGITAATWTSLGNVDPFTSNVVSPTRLYLATGLSFGEASTEGTEVIRHVVMPLAEAVEAVLESRITHAPTCVAILKAERLL
ncbi:NUDIX domain-containing protein [Candidatus Laterigemmans baculatus]|uniref:NUDIX domain-containing protein n=1 Tax=Candidatus Laterigemmans baculatus TaxID=2770505 RepID=UPI0013DBC36F|nr:NUDIX hydrolase [Candidatus Laterigemmans baculatus]